MTLATFYAEFGAINQNNSDSSRIRLCPVTGFGLNRISVALETEEDLSMREVWRGWLPLAASWVLMAAELPILSAVVARLAEPEINLAAYGGVVFPVALVIESPIIMLLAASTALCRDQDSYRRLFRFMMGSGAGLTVLHAGVAFTPVFDWIVRGWIQAPESIIEPSRLGLRLMTPWTWAIAHRRFHQGVLIRVGHSRDVGWGTSVRLCSVAAVLAAGYGFGRLPGIAVATLAVSTGVLAEAAFIYGRARPCLGRWPHRTRGSKALTMRTFLPFYLPLAMTPFFELLVIPVTTSAISRMPLSLQSLAVWPATHGLIFLFRSVGIAFNEVVISQLDRPRGAEVLHRFSVWLAGALAFGLFLIACTPAGMGWFRDLSGLKPDLAEFAAKALILAVLLPAISVRNSWYQGNLVHAHQTRGVTESVVLYLLTCTLSLTVAVAWNRIAGLHAGLISLTTAGCVQMIWLAHRRRQLQSNPVPSIPSRHPRA